MRENIFRNKNFQLVYNIVKFQQLKIRDSLSYTFSNIEINSGREGDFSFKVYTKGKIYFGSWGFHDYGELALSHEEIYIYENGFGFKDKPPTKPKEFKLYFSNPSDKRIDSIFSDNNSIIKIYEATPRNFHITYDYDKIQIKPDFRVSIEGKKLSKSLAFHDFENWNDTQDFLHFEDDTLSNSVTVIWKEPLEFIVDLEVRIPDSLSSIKIESSAITKVYEYYKPKYKRIALDFKKFKASPIIYVNTQGKKYTIDLSKHDFSNIHYWQKIYYLESNGIRSVTDD